MLQCLVRTNCFESLCAAHCTWGKGLYFLTSLELIPLIRELKTNYETLISHLSIPISCGLTEQCLNKIHSFSYMPSNSCKIVFIKNYKKNIIMRYICWILPFQIEKTTNFVSSCIFVKWYHTFIYVVESF